KGDKGAGEEGGVVGGGKSGKLLDELAKTLGEFEEAVEVTRGARLDHVGATADLQAVLGEISQQVRVLDGLVRYRFGDNEELMGAWASAHNVVGPFRKSSPPDDAAGSTTAAA